MSMQARGDGHIILILPVNPFEASYLKILFLSRMNLIFYILLLISFLFLEHSWNKQEIRLTQIPWRIMATQVCLHAFLISIVYGDEQKSSSFRHFTPGTKFSVPLLQGKTVRYKSLDMVAERRFLPCNRDQNQIIHHVVIYFTSFCIWYSLLFRKLKAWKIVSFHSCFKDICSAESLTSCLNVLKMWE
jgi:amino acid transporter